MTERSTCGGAGRKSLLVTLLAAVFVLGFAMPTFAITANAADARQAYDASAVYDSAAHSVQVHASEETPVGSRDVFEGVQGTAAVAAGPLSVVLARSVAAETASAGGSNFMASGEAFAENAANAKPLPGYHDVVVHGTPTDFGATGDAWANGTNFSHRVLSNLIESDPAYGGGPIRLLSCSTGGCGATAAQNLSNKLGVEVFAPTDTLWAYPSGNLVVGPEPTLPTGGWMSFFPGAKP
jgi:hypothetical protein